MEYASDAESRFSPSQTEYLKDIDKKLSQLEWQCIYGIFDNDMNSSCIASIFMYKLASCKEIMATFCTW